MGFHFGLANSKDARCYNFLFFIMESCLLIIIYVSSVTEAQYNESINIGAIIDVDSRVGKEQKTAMMMAAQSFNKISTNHKLTLHFQNIGNNPIEAVSAAEKLITEKQVQVIIGLQTWEQAVLVSDVGKRAQVPVLSLASFSHPPQFMQNRWPFLVPVAPNNFDQLTCIASMIGSYHWRKVIAIYEDNTYGGDSGLLALLAEALQGVDAEIESHLVLQPASIMGDPERMVGDEVAKLLRAQSRVFVVLQSSLSLATHLFREAKKIGLMGRDSVWIVADSLTNLLDSVDTSFISSLQGALGTQMFYSEETKPFLEFKHEFQRKLRLDFPDEYNLEPGIHALRAYDGITAVLNAVKQLGSQVNTNISMSILHTIQAHNFSGLTGDVHFQGEAQSSTLIFRIVNVVGKRYKELGYWSSSFGFTDNLKFDNGKTNLSAVNGLRTMQKLSGLVNWPGELNRTPKGWAMPTNAKPMRIGVPGRTTFEKFVRVDWDNKTNTKKYDGFCIDVFEEVLEILEQEYSLPYVFVPYNGSYDALVENVFNKTFDAAVGDITILSNRSKYVDFTHSFAESGLSMLVHVKPDSQRTWIFMKPFTLNMWFASYAIMFYTTFVVWFMEKDKNKQFKDKPWKDQLGTAVWFTFSSVFFAQRENITRNHSRAVLGVWFVLVFILTSSYTASLTSMLTIRRYQDSVTDIEMITKTNATVGCDGDSYVADYLRDVIKITNIKSISSPDSYPGEFDSGNIKAAFLEMPYQKVFLTKYCNDYIAVGPTFRIGGLGFVFQKGSPIAHDFSRAILTLMENGKLRRLEDEWLGSSMKCSYSDDSRKSESLNFENFLVLFFISAATSTICFLTFVARKQYVASVIKVVKGIVDMVVQQASYLHRSGNSRIMLRAPTFSRRWSSLQWDLVSPTDPSEQFEASSSGDLKLP